MAQPSFIKKKEDTVYYSGKGEIPSTTLNIKYYAFGSYI